MTHDILPPANRRLFLRHAGLGLGGVALAGLLGRDARAEDRGGKPHDSSGVLDQPHHPP